MTPVPGPSTSSSATSDPTSDIAAADVGRRRRLLRLADANGVIAGIAIDHRDSLRVMLERRGAKPPDAAELRSLKLILATAQRHLDQLDAGEVPGDTFAASVGKYEQALVTLGVLEMLGEDDIADDGTVEVQREGLAALIELLRASDVGYVIQDAEEGSVLDSIVALVGTGEPQEVPGG